jgi:hypothetical protein
VSCKPRSAQHQRHWLSTPFRSYGGALRVAPESSLEVASQGSARVMSSSLTITPLRGTPHRSDGQLQFVSLIGATAAVRFAHAGLSVRIAASDIVSLWRAFSGVDTPGLGMISRMGAWGMTEATAKFSNEISIVAKAAGVGDLADGLACFQKRPAF